MTDPNRFYPIHPTIEFHDHRATSRARITDTRITLDEGDSRIYFTLTDEDGGHTSIRLTLDLFEQMLASAAQLGLEAGDVR